MPVHRTGTHRRAPTVKKGSVKESLQKRRIVTRASGKANQNNQIPRRKR